MLQKLKIKYLIIKDEIPKEITYDGKLFNKDRLQGKLKANELNYRCKNNRKDERTKKTTFCKSLIKRKTQKKNINYNLEKLYYKECNEFTIINIKNESNLIGNYNDFINICLSFLDSTETYNKKDFETKLLQIYNENIYNFKLKENTIKNIIGY